MRSASLLIALLLLSSALAEAQGEPPTARPRVTVSAFTGVRAPFSTGYVAAYDQRGALLFELREQRGGNPILGTEAEVRLHGRLSLVAAGVFSRGGEREFFVPDTVRSPHPDVLLKSGTNTLFGRIGLLYRFDPDRRISEDANLPSTDLFAGPALVRELGSTHPALGFGFKGTLPVAPGVDFLLGLEDYFVFWNRGSLETNLAQGFRTRGDDPFFRVDEVETFYDTSNVLLLRAGVSLRH